MSKRLKICFISAYFPPSIAPEAFVSGRLAEWFRRAGHHVRVFSNRLPRTGRFRRLRKLLDNGYAVLRYNFRLIQRQTLDLVRLAEIAEFVDQVLTLGTVEHRQRPFDVIVSRYKPVESHIAAYWLARRTGVPWVACFNDPWPTDVFEVDDSVLGFTQRAHRAAQTLLWHRRLLEGPDGLVFPSDRLRDLILEQAEPAGAAALREKSSILPHMGFAAEDLASVRDGAPNASGIRTLRHVGSVYHRRDLTTLLKALGMWDASGRADLLVELIGDVHPQYRAQLEAAARQYAHVRIGVRGQVSAAQALAAIRSATACLLVEFVGPESVYLPTKLCEYATAGRPVLALTPETSTVRDYLTRFGGGVAVAHGDGEGAFSGLCRVLEMSEGDCAPLGLQFAPSRVGELWENLLWGLKTGGEQRCRSSA